MFLSRTKLFYLVPCCFLLFMLSLAGWLKAEEKEALAKVVKIGYVTFDGPSKTTGTLTSLVEYFKFLSDSSRKPGSAFSKEVDFAVSLGNYYQILAWMRNEELDAAVVSSYTALLLRRDGRAVPIIEFRGKDEDLGHHPIIAASGSDRDHPEEAYKKYLKTVLTEARKTLGEREAVDDGAPNQALAAYNIYMVTHLSTTGFIEPVLYAQNWLTKENVALDSAEADQFWRLFFQNVTLRMQHKMPANVRPGGISIYFSYKGHSGDYDSVVRKSLDLGDWKVYDILMPNDVLVVRPEIADEILKRPVPWRSLLPRNMNEMFRGSENYQRVQQYHEGPYLKLQERVSSVFGPSAINSVLRELGQRWYVEGRFDFTVKETMDFLRLDKDNHKNSPARLSLVLPGGGVKSIYQAGILDELYNGCFLTNGSANSVSCASFRESLVEKDVCSQVPDGRTLSERVARPPEEDVPSQVENVIGTSGGAMVGLMVAALVSPNSQTGLTAKVIETASGRIFPQVDMLRWLSIYVLIVLLLLILTALKLIKALPSRYRSDREEFRPAPWKFQAALWLLLLTGPFLIWYTRAGNMDSVPKFEAVLYGMSLLACHFLLICSVCRQTGLVAASPLRNASAGQARLLSGLGLLFMVFSYFARRFEPSICEQALGDSGPLASPCSSLASLGVFTVVIGAIYLVYAGGLGLAIEGIEKYLRALSLVALQIALAYALLSVSWWNGWTTYLELTLEFWLWLIGCGLVAAFILAAMACRSPGQEEKGGVRSFLHKAFLSLAAQEEACRSVTTPGSQLAWLSAAGLLGWAVIVAPALYGSKDALESFKQVVPVPDDLHTNLVVTGSLLRDSSCDHGDQFPQGDVYFCFGEPDAGCAPVESSRWVAVGKADPEIVVDAAFASGSPFPVFPPHKVSLPNGCTVPLVDGGYAHNIPLEAAKLGKSRQVLIVQSTPDPVVESAAAFNWPLSQLVLYSGRIFPFLFSRAQELDRNAGTGLFVATLAPDPMNGEFPYLTDFRLSVIERMEDAARRDICYNRRIGRIQSWGLPEMFAQARASSFEE